jgi:hypothetical protein
MSKTLEETWAQAELTKKYRQKNAALIGRTIVDVRAMSAEEVALGGWTGNGGPVFLLDNGDMFTPHWKQLITHRGN